METQQSSSNVEVLFNPFPKQIEFLEAVFGGKYTFIMYGGSIRGGKTFAGIGALLLLCKKYPKSKWAIVRTDLQTLKRNSIPSFWKCCPKSFIKHYSQDNQVVTFTNDSQIMFFGENYADDKDLNRWRGLEVNGFLLEELNELQYKSFNKAIERAGSNVIDPKPKPLIIATCNPANNWVKELIYNKHLAGELPEKWLYITAKIFDNPYVASDLDYMEALKTMPPMEYDLFVNGDWNSFAVNNPFAYCFDETKHVGKCEFDPNLELMLSFDFNKDPITCVVSQHGEARENSQHPEIDLELRYIKEFKLSNSDIYALCEAIKTTYDYHNPLYLITGDATGRARSALVRGNINYWKVIKQEFGVSDNQIKTPSVNPSVKDTRVLMNSMFVNYNVVVDPDNCPAFIKDLKFVECDEFGDLMKDRTGEYKKADLLDCARYNQATFFKWFIKNNPKNPLQEYVDESEF